MAQAILDNPATAGDEILRVIEAAKTSKRPVYLEIPRDSINWQTSIRQPAGPASNYHDEAMLREALDEIATLLGRAQAPVIIAGVEIHRFGLE